MQTIYNEQGVAKTLDSVDAREHVATGRWFREAPVKESVNVQVIKQEQTEVIDATATIFDSTEESKPETTTKAASKAKKEKEVTTEVIGE